MDIYEQSKKTAQIRVVGVGGAGCNAVNTMIDSGLERVDFIACNTDVQALATNKAGTKVHLGAELTRGLGAGADPEVGRQAATASKDEIAKHLEGADMVFVTAGMGGGTGTGAAPVIADIARSMGCLTVGVVTKPFIFEGNRRRKAAEQGMQEIKAAVDTLITIPNQRLLTLSAQNLPLLEAFKMADTVLLNAVRGISDLIQYHGYINVDFADVKTIMSEQGLALMGTGAASGENRALRAVQEAIASPLLEDVTIDGARGILVNITGGRDLTLNEVDQALSLVYDAADPECNIIFGSLIDENMRDGVKITIIATGFTGQPTKVAARGQQQQPTIIERPVQVPLITRAPAQPLPTVTVSAQPPPVITRAEEVATLVPSSTKPGARTLSNEHRVVVPRHTAPRDASLPLDEDQFDIPTFLRRQGHTEMP